MRAYLASHPDQRAKSNARRAQHYEEKKEHHLAVCRKNYYANHDERKATKRAYVESHRVEEDKRKREWQAEHAQHIAETRRKRYEDQKERILAENRQRSAERKDQYNGARRDKLASLTSAERLKRSRKAYLSNPEAYKQRSRNRTARLKGADGSHSSADVRRQYVMQSGACFWCDRAVGVRFDVDHLIPLSKGGSNWPWNLVIACPRCNRSKHDHFPLDWAPARRRSAA
jgi:5-methylcytosine-specific restriction endonuclease McrA